jgi:hypothetical protein
LGVAEDLWVSSRRAGVCGEREWATAGGGATSPTSLPPSVAEISATIDALTGWETQRILVDGPPPAPTVGDHPWAVPRPVVAGMAVAIDEVGYEQPATNSEAVVESVTWALESCAGRDWREVFTTLTNHPDLFDYVAEDAFLRDK